MRTFIAIELPSKLKEKIGQFEGEIKNLIPLRLVTPQNLHLTLFFLGEVGKAGIPKVVEAVKTGTRRIKPFFLFLDKAEFFPKTGRVHGLWLNLEGQLGALDKLYRQISQELKVRNFDLETRPFTAHITLGRAKKRIKRKLLSNLAIELVRKQKFKAASVSIFTSQLAPEGPIYTRQVKIDLI